ncbi:CHAT domain-containing protein [Roseofilum capinflatum]|uniref:CHAT domain-containing protein n=1 Tax=Roseofilum capinflatum BLCC-M114 TaxID=3022440 RepID=A0ABT7B0R1_9CYAN|nr:CHAT domain-containing protein [Roseofilum capinflatum]MDJ1172715.1 CHAT domain-containing protein [Roseofilum capinflatum BLCC-M114]
MPTSNLVSGNREIVNRGNSEINILQNQSDTINGINRAIASTPRETSDNSSSASVPIDSQQAATALISRGSVQRLLDEGQLQQAVEVGDRLLSEEFADYLNKPLPQQQLSFAQLQNQLEKMSAQMGNSSALLYMISRSEQLDLVLVPPTGEPIYHSIPEASNAALIAKIKAFQAEIANPIRRRSTSYLDASQQLYQWLIAPIEAELEAQGITTLLFSLDSGLRSLPIAALHDGEQFLVEKYQFSLVPSLSLTDTRYQNLQKTPVLAMGASEFSDQTPLPAVPVELSTISEQLWQGQAFLNQELTVENFNQQRAQSDYGIIHLATHGQFKPGRIEESYIQFWDRKIGLDQITNLNLTDPPIQLLVLSACRTALGDRQAEFGFAGLAVQSGAQSALASLWYASDLGALGLMAEFYHHLQTEDTKSGALRRAQIAVLRQEVQIKDGKLIGNFGEIDLPPELNTGIQPNLIHPYYWSGFTLIGNP